MINTKRRNTLQSAETTGTSVPPASFRIMLSALIIIVALTILSSFTSMPHGRYVNEKEDSVAPGKDSVLYVVAFFNKNDTMIYWINESQWDVKNGDTIKTMGINTKVMVNVTDSTKKGYKMEYTFLEFVSDSVKGSWKQKLLTEKFDTLKKVLKGTTIKFTTDEYGKIVKYDNLDKIAKQAKQLFMSVVKEMPIIDSLDAMGADTKKLLKDVDYDNIVKGYTEELEPMFRQHGEAYNIGTVTEHTDATEDEFESDSYVEVSEDPETYDYKIEADTYNYIPKDDVRAILKGLVEGILKGDELSDVKKDIGDNLDKQVTGRMRYNDYLLIEYYSDGWPKKIVKQEKNMIGNNGKLSQKYIIPCYRSVRH